MTSELSVGDYAHWKGWGLVKITGKYFYPTWNHDIYKVKTGLIGNGFGFGIKEAHPHELSKISDADAKAYIKKMKDDRSARGM